MTTATHSARIIRISADDPQTKAALEIEKRLLDHYGLQGKSDYVALKQTPIRVRVLEVGAGRPIVVVPGGAGEARGYLALAAHMKDWRWIIINRPGAGLSDFVDHRQIDLKQLAVDMIGSVMDARGLDSAPLVGNSMGGLWCFWFALAQPQRITRMVQLGCPALVLNTSAPFFMRLIGIPVLGRKIAGFMVAKDLDTALRGMKMMGSSDEVVKAMPRLENEAQYVFTGIPTFREDWYTLLQAVLNLIWPKARYRLGAESLARLQMPVLLIWGDNDPFGALTVARQVARIIPNARLCEVSTGHLPYIDQPETCGRLIREFLA